MDDKNKIENQQEKILENREDDFSLEIPKIPEKRENIKEDEVVAAELRRELEIMEADENTKAGAEKEKEKIEFLGEKEKIEHLLKIAREKGVVFAISVARKMNEPYLLDLLHDTLAREGFYKDFTK